MKKLIKLEFDNTTKERKTEDSFSELYSYDKNNGTFEFEILNDTLTTEQVTALFKFTESNKIWKTTGTVEGNKVNVTFDTSLITQNETVVCYLYLDEEQRTSDTFRFKFKVKVSEIDKMNRYEVKERFINNTVIIDRLDVVTKEELKEALKNVGGIATEGLLTETKAEETYAKKSEAVDNTNFELVKNRVLALELKTDKDTVYDDSELKGRISMLENKPNIDVSNLATKEELEAVRGSQPSIDNLVTKDELAGKNYLTEHQNLDEYAKKSEIPQEYNDTEVKERLTNLENKASLDLSNLATKQELNEVRNSQPIVDTSNLVTRDELTAKNFLTTHQDLSEYAKKSELYNDTPLKERVRALEERPTTTYDDSEIKEKLKYLEPLFDYRPAPRLIEDNEIVNRLDRLEQKEDKDTKYDDAELRGRVEVLENKPNVDLTNYVTSEQLENKHYLTQHQPLDNLVTKEELNSKGFVTDEVLNSKGYLTEHQPLTDYVSKQELEDKGYINSHQDLSEYAKKSELYNDSEVKERLTTLENKPNVDLSGYVTSEQLEAKNYLTSHQPLTHLATTSDLEALRNIAVSKSELSKKLDATEYNTFKDIVVTKDELAGKGYLTEHQDISNLATKQEVEDTYAKKSEIPTAYNDSALVNRVSALESKQDNDTVYNDTEVKQRLTALESRPTSQSEMRGTGMPNGVVEAPIGTTYIDITKTNGALKWIKTTDGGNTGWEVVEGDTGWVLVWQRGVRDYFSKIEYAINKMYFRRKNDIVHVKFETESKTESNKHNSNLTLIEGSFDETTGLSIKGFQPVDDVVQTIFNTPNEIRISTPGADNPEASRGMGAVIIQYEYRYNYTYKRQEENGLELQIVTSETGVKENYVNPFSYLTEDEWPTELPTI